MSKIPMNTNSAVARSLAVWHEMIASKDLGRLPDIVHPDAVFRSPVAFAPYHTAPALVLAISTVIQVFEDFAYHRQFSGDEGLDVVLEFSARVGDKKIKGVDCIRFDTQGRIVDFEVMVRPLSGLQALAAEMGARIGSQIPAFKTKA